jgi:hypothetical protein
MASDCGCGTGSKGSLTPLSPGDPFIDDELQAPPIPATEARLQRRYVDSFTHAASYVGPAPVRRQPATLIVSGAKPIDDQGARAAAVEVSKSVGADAISVKLRAPVNPLRD